MNRRRGFTLIEMLVATALTLFLMVILSEAFVTALDTFSGLKAIGDMEEGLRTASTLLRFELRQPHFDGQRKLSDVNIASAPPQLGFFCIRQGLPYNVEGVDSQFTPSNFLPSFYANGGAGGSNHTLHFSIRLNGAQPSSVFSTAVASTSASPSPLAPYLPGGAPNSGYQSTSPQAFDALFQPAPPAGASFAVYNSQWAEVAYFLQFQGTTADPHNPGAATGPGVAPLYGLYRLQWLVPTLNAAAAAAAGNNVTANTPSDLANQPTVSLLPAGSPSPTSYSLTYTRGGFDNPFNFGASPPFYSPSVTGGTSNLLLNNVVSFNVRIFQSFSGITSLNSTPLNAATPGLAVVTPVPVGYYDTVVPAQTTDALTTPDAGQFPRPAFDTSGNMSVRLWDTSAGAFISVPVQNSFPVSALEISIRVWDQKTQQTRQITMLQDM